MISYYTGSIIEVWVYIMQDIIDKLFIIDMEDNSFLYHKESKEDVNTEWELFHRLFEQLPQQQRDLFLEYARLRDARADIEKQICYKRGFQTATQLFTEALKK